MIMKECVFLFHRKLRKIELTVSHCFDVRRTAIDKQSPAGVARLKDYFKYLWILSLIFTIYRRTNRVYRISQRT